MKRQLSMALALLILAMACVPAWASDGDISVVAVDVKKSPSECNYWVLKHRGKTQGSGFGSCRAPLIRVYAQLTGASAGGITGAEYACQIGDDGAPDPGYFLIELPNPTANTLLGSAVEPPDPSPRGVNIAWNNCQTGDGNRMLLATVLVMPTAACGPSNKPPRISFTGVQHSDPSNVFFRCPLFTLCDGPVFTKVCLGDNIVDCETPIPPFPIASKCSTSGSFVINPAPGQEGSCTSLGKAGETLHAVQSDTWSNVKSLYR